MYVHQAEWHSRTTLRFYQSSDLVSLLSPASGEGPPLLSLPPLDLQTLNLAALHMPPLESVLRLPATLEHVNVPLPPHDQW